MGKKKQAQRTKNNVVPASSGRSAELLQSSSGVPFVGFSTLKEGGFIPILSGISDELDTNINEDFRLVWKKMNKKDSTTKLKALDEFKKLCKEVDVEALKPVLPFWPRLFCALSTDEEHRVREAAHAAHRAVVCKAGRNIAPYLKQLVGPWFTGQHDTYAPAASMAESAFQEAFPPNKLIEAIVFCQEEILNYITNNLLNQTAQSLANNPNVSQEVKDARYQRVVVSCLNGYALYLQRLPTEQLRKAEEANLKLVSSAKFWKFNKDPAPIVRAAWFTALVALCEKAPFLLSQETKHACMAVFTNIDDTDPVVARNVWQAALLLFTVCEDVWNHVSLQKQVLPKLWKVLSDGADGNASLVFPHLLPLLSKIPPAMVTDKAKLYAKFFENLRCGLKVRNVQISAIETNAVVTAFLECLRYLVNINGEDDKLCLSLFEEQVFPLIENVISDAKMHLARPCLFSGLASLVNHWSKPCTPPPASPTAPPLAPPTASPPDLYLALTTLYWRRLAVLCRLQLEAHVVDPITLASNCTAVEVLLSALKKTDTQPRKHFRVKFVSPRKSPEDEPEVSFPSAEDSPLSPQYRNQCNQLVFSQLAVCFQLINSCGDNTRAVLVTHLGRVVEEYQSSQLLQQLLDVTQLSWSGLYSRYLAVWLRNDNLPLNDTLRLIFTLLQYVQDDQQVLAVFADLGGEDSYSAYNEEGGLELEPLQEVRWQAVVECALRPEYQSASVRRWLASHGSVCHLASLLTREHPSYNTVHNCLYNLRNNSWLTTESLHQLICSLRQNLASPSVSEDVQTCSADLLQALLHNPVNHPFLAKLPAEDLRSLLYELFTGSLQQLTQYPNSWPQCLAVLALQSETDLAVSAVCETCVDLLVAVVRTRPMDLVESQQLTNVLEQLILSAARSCDDSITSLATTVLSRLVAKLRSQAEAVWNLLGVAETVLGNLRNEALSCTQRKSHEKTDPLDNVPLNHYITSMIPFLIMVVKLQTASTSGETEDSAAAEDQFPYAKLRTVLPAEDRWDWSQQGLQLQSICVSFKNHFSNTKQYFLLKEKITFILEECGLLSQLKVRDVVKHLFLSKEGESSLKLQDPLTRLQTEVLLRDLGLLYDAHHIRKELIPLKSNSAIVKHYYFPNEVLEEISASGQIDRSQLPIINTCCRRLVELRSDSDTESGSTHIAILDRVFDQFLAEEKENRSLLSLSDEQLHSLAEVVEFTCHSVTHDSAHLTQSSWDACLVATAALAHSTRTTLHDWTSQQTTLDVAVQKQRSVPSTQPWPLSLLQEKKEVGEEDSLRLVLVRVLCAICRLFNAVSAHMAAVDPQDKAAATRCAEWTDVFLADSHSAISQAWFKIADIPCIYPARFLLVETLSSSMAGFVYFPHFVEGTNTLGALDSCCRLLQSSHTLVQLTAYQLMLKLIPAMVELDMKQCEKDNVALSCQHVDQTLLYTQSIIDVILSGLSFGDLCVVEPFTDSYCYTRCYLLLWSALLQLCAHACAQLRPLYTTWLKEGYLSVFMKTVFCLMPEAALHGEVQSQRISQLFSKPPLLDKGVWGSERLAALSCWVYACSLRRLPAAVRQWWNEADHRVYALVEQVTAIYLSPDLCAEEMRAIQTQEKKFDNMTVHVHPTSKEVYAVYTVEESRMELVIELAHNHPLGLVKVRSGQSMVSTTQTRQWLMQITILLTHQNGSIWDALELWKHSLDKRFEGVEECYICFAILHSVSRQLPKLSCQTCRKKFHSHCLYKWFTTSNKSTCPICRNLF